MTELEFKSEVFSLSKRLYPMVLRLLGTRDETEDAIQDIMLKLWTKRKQLSKHPNLKAFVFLTARNYCIDLLRKKKKTSSDSIYPMEDVSATSMNQHLEWKELNAIIKKILEDLPDQQREVLLMRDIDGYEYPEIAAMTQLKVEHVRVLLSRARKQLSIRLEKIYHYEKR